MRDYGSQIERSELWEFLEKDQPITIFSSIDRLDEMYEDIFENYLASQNEKRRKKGKPEKKYSLLEFRYERPCKEIMLPIGHYFTNPKESKFELVEALEQIIDIICERYYLGFLFVEGSIVMHNELPFGIIKCIPMDKNSLYSSKGAFEVLGFGKDKEKGTPQEQFFYEIEKLIEEVALSYQ